MNWKLLFPCLLIIISVIGISAEVDDDDGFVTTDEEVPSVDGDIAYMSPHPSGNVYLAEHFDDPNNFKKNWVISEAKKEDTDEDIAKYDGQWTIEEPLKDGLRGDLGLVLKSKAKHSAVSARLNRVFEFKGKPLVVQYEVIFQEGQECGGAYLKLLSEDQKTKELRYFHDKTPYTIMFGPDKCGNDHKLHFIFRHRNPMNGTLSEKHSKKPKDRLEEPFKDKQPHLYTLVLRPDNSFEVSLDRKVINEGSLLKDFTPPVNPPAEIEDPEDHKPSDWDEREKIPDPLAEKPDDWDENAPAQIADASAVKPEGWLDDEPEMIPDPNAEKPDDWDTDMDGEWEAPLVTNPLCESAPGCGQWKPPMIANPNYKGKWHPPLIDNPNYKGKWFPQKIPNPDHFQDDNPFRMTPISAVGLELWSMSNMILFDNFIVTDDPVVADQWATDTFDLKRRKLDKQGETMWYRVMRSINYKPGWWGLYFVYCSLPVGIYAWYLWSRVAEESLIGRLISYTNEQPWLWAVYLIVVGLPIVLLLVFCCGPSVQETEDFQKAAEAKKTDAPTPDDVEEMEGAEAEQQEKVSKSKTDLDQREEEEVVADNDNIDDVGETENATGDAPPSPRKRRPRKE